MLLSQATPNGSGLSVMVGVSVSEHLRFWVGPRDRDRDRDRFCVGPRDKVNIRILSRKV